MADNYWLDRNVFVTGCTGLLGSWLTGRLVAAGAHVVGLVRDLVPRSRLALDGNAEKITVVRGALEDYEGILRALNEYEIQTVFHLGAQTIVTIANRAPLSTFEANIKGTWTVLEAARHCPTLEAMVVASSDKAYGEHETLPYSEEAPLRGLHPYDASKSCCDLLAQTYHHTYRLPLAITRCGNLFGGGDLNFNRVVPGTMRSAYRGTRPIIRSDGTPQRDYVFAGDAADFYLLLARRVPDPGICGEAFNFGPAKPLTVAEMVRAALKAAGRADLEPDIQGKAPPPGEITHQYLSSKKAEERLGWKPPTPLDDALSQTWEWYRRFFAHAGDAAPPATT